MDISYEIGQFFSRQLASLTADPPASKHPIDPLAPRDFGQCGNVRHFVIAGHLDPFAAASPVAWPEAIIDLHAGGHDLCRRHAERRDPA